LATKKQHYVWRGYLKRWNENEDRFGRVYVYRKNVWGNQPEIEYALLENVGFGKYFYDMTGFSKADISVVSQLIAHIQKDNLVSLGLNPELLGDANAERDFIETLMEQYEDIDNKYQFLDKMISGDLSFYKDSLVQETLNDLYDEVMNALFGGRKKSDMELMVDTLNAMEHIGDEDLKHEFHRFFFMQHQRSPVIHETQVNNFENLKSQYPAIKDINSNFYANSLMIFFAEIMSVNVSNKMHTWIERYDNKTKVPFVTTDTPVVNLIGMEFLEKNEFYYPISPKIAIKLCVTSKRSKYSKAKNICMDMTDENEVKKLNLTTAKNCYNEVFSNDEGILKNIRSELQS
jgi:hypothetical protein